MASSLTSFVNSDYVDSVFLSACPMLSALHHILTTLRKSPSLKSYRRYFRVNTIAKFTRFFPIALLEWIDKLYDIILKLLLKCAKVYEDKYFE